MPDSAGSYQPASHYDRVTAAWTLLLGDELHYGVFDDPGEDLATATGRLTRLMLESARIESSSVVLDVGCGTGEPARMIAAETGARVTGITTSAEGVATARRRTAAAGLSEQVQFELRDGTANGFEDDSFDRVWVLESSHLMRHRDRLIAECGRVLRSGGRLVLCDIVLRRPMELAEVKRLREPLALLRRAFGDARMEPLDEYRRLVESEGLTVERQLDLTTATRPTFARWRENAERHRETVLVTLAETEWQDFVDSCDVLERFWDDGTLGYGLIAAVKR